MERPIECDISNYINVNIYNDIDSKKFQEIISLGEPAILEGCNFGDCFDKWNLNYLNNLLKDEKVVIHKSHQTDLNFIDKNFKYTTCKFSEFYEQLLNPKNYVYLRSTNNNPRTKKASRIEEDFPVLAHDLKPPEFIPFGPDDVHYHSSVMRLASSNVQIWTHFDLYDNVLAQVVGTKRIVLLPPEDTKHLYVKGDKSPVDCFDNWRECLQKYPLIGRAKLYYCQLKPKQVLFIPSLWWHNIKTVSESPSSSSSSSSQTSSYSIGFNIFWRDPAIEMRSFYADGDVYGNKDLIPVSAALANLDKIVQHLNKLPGKYNTFYKMLLLQQLKRKLFPADVDNDEHIR